MLNPGRRGAGRIREKDLPNNYPANVDKLLGDNCKHYRSIIYTFMNVCFGRAIALNVIPFFYSSAIKLAVAQKARIFNMARRTKEEALETRNRILDAAEEVFHENGVARTSLADVALAAEVTRGAIYWHFKNKSDLFDAMCQRIRLPMETMVETVADEHTPDPLGQLRSTCRFLFQETMTNPHYRKVLDILFHKCEFVDPTDPIYIRQQEWFQHGMLNMERILGNAIVKGQLPPDLDIRLARIFFCSNIDGLLKSWLFVPGCFDLGKDADKMVDACIEALNCVPSLRQNLAA